jgi:hypothetical protein
MNRPRAQRILGMTIPQLLILGCLTLSIICTFVGGYWALNTVVASAYAIPILPGLNVTPLPTSTPAPTATLLPTASPTPITYESLIPAGWKQFKSENAPGMEIWFPPSYVVLTESLMQANDMNYVPLSEAEGQEGLTSILNLVDMTASPYMLYTTFGMSTQPLPAADLDKTIDQEFANMMLNARLMERGNFEIRNYPARKVVFDITGNGVTAGLVAYLIQENGTVWYLGFTTPYNELYTRMPVFDQIAQTFRIVRP